MPNRTALRKPADDDRAPRGQVVVAVAGPNFPQQVPASPPDFQYLVAAQLESGARTASHRTAQADTPDGTGRSARRPHQRLPEGTRDRVVPLQRPRHRIAQPATPFRVRNGAGRLPDRPYQDGVAAIRRGQRACTRTAVIRPRPRRGSPALRPTRSSHCRRAPRRSTKYGGDTARTAVTAAAVRAAARATTCDRSVAPPDARAGSIRPLPGRRQRCPVARARPV